jgi:hypothetical protein
MSTQPAEETECPSCASKVVVKGSLVASDEDEKFNGLFFPEGLKFTAIRRSVAVLEKQGFLACTNCGCLWSYVEADKLRELLKNKREGKSAFAPGLSHRTKWALLLLLAFVVIGASVGITSLFGS